MRSMTGYGVGRIENENYDLKVEIRSVNSRFTDINIRLPKIIFNLEESVRKSIKEKNFKREIGCLYKFKYI